MLDASLRHRLQRPLDKASAWLEKRNITPNHLTVIGFLIGVGACLAVAADRWTLGLVLWLLNRLIDGLDGSLARRVGETRLGGFLDIMADFAIYGGIVLALGWAVPEARLAALVVFLAYYLNGSSFLAWSSIVQIRIEADPDAAQSSDGRSLHFQAGLAEGTETILAMSLMLLLPDHTVTLLWIWAGIVGITVVQRVCFVAISLAGDRSSPEGRAPAP
jgi:phosphatidylglycerophosphate synthase